MKFKKVDFSKNYRIESVPSKDQPELAKKGVGAFPGTVQAITVGFNRTLNRAVNTGLDIHSPEILSLPKEEKDKAVEWIKQAKEELENLIGQPGYLDPTSDGWFSELATVLIETGQDLKIRVNGHDNYLRPSMSHRDKIALLVLANNPNFPQSKEDIKKPQFRDARYYLTTDDELQTVIETQLSDKKKIYVHLNELFKEGANKNRPWEVAFYVGLIRKKIGSISNLELNLHNAIESDKDTAKKFIEACEMSEEKLLLHNMFEKAILYGIVKYGKDDMYYRGSMNYRNTKEGSIEFLEMPSMLTELAGLREAVAKEDKKHNK